MPKSYENQKRICIHKPRVTANFLQIANAEWMQANKTLTPYGLQLYLYLASNTDQYQFALSPAAAEEYAGIKSTTFHKYLRLLEIEGYLVWRKGSLYDFYTTPREPNQRTHPDQHCECIKRRIPHKEIGCGSWYNRPTGVSNTWCCPTTWHDEIC